MPRPSRYSLLLTNSLLYKARYSEDVGDHVIEAVQLVDWILEHLNQVSSDEVQPLKVGHLRLILGQVVVEQQLS